MKTYEESLQEADDEGVEVIDFAFHGNNKGMYSDGIIAIRKDIDTNTEKKCILIEELGHHCTSTGDITDQGITTNRKQELKARLWAYNDQVGLFGIVRAFENRCKNLYEMADFLEVTEDFLKDALECYKNIYGISTELDNYIIRFIPNLQVTKLL